jgi:HTH-type transcriptional regulator / antitoxin HigA
MITNERQYKITRSQAVKFEDAIKQFNELHLVKQGWDPLLVKAQLSALQSQLEELRNEIRQYEILRSGEITQLSATTVSEIGKRLIEARIAQGLSQKILADRLGMKEQQIQRYEHERYRSASLSRLAEICEALDVTFNLDIGLAGATNSKNNNLLHADFDLSKLPIREIRKRGWLKDALPNSKHIDQDQMLSSFMLPAFEGAIPALLKSGARVGRQLDQYALLAWKARIVWKIRKEHPPAAGASLDADLSWVNTFKEFTLDDRGPALAVEYLRKKGIAVVFEKHLPETYLDGAAILVDNTISTIALTLRYDRLDNFWFVLLHELGHTLLHRESGLSTGFFDDDSVEVTEKAEREADAFAKSVFLPEEKWTSSLVRFTQSTEQVVQFARENRISPAIIAGWIRRERNDYTIFKELVGHGKVRKSLKKAGLLETSNVTGV